jgi:hypothetical protein
MGVTAWLSRKLRMAGAITGGEPFTTSVGEFKPPEEPTADDRYFAGLSVGRPGAEPTALAVVLRRNEINYLVALKRWPPTGNTWSVASEAAAAMAATPLQDATLGIERTGVGEETYEVVYSAFRGWFPVKPIWIKTTAELSTARRPFQGTGWPWKTGWQVPRLDLAALVSELLNAGKLVVDAGKFGKEADMVLAELRAFVAQRPSGAHEALDARVSGNEDVSRAISAALFLAAKPAGFWFSASS